MLIGDIMIQMTGQLMPSLQSTQPTIVANFPGPTFDLDTVPGERSRRTMRSSRAAALMRRRLLEIDISSQGDDDGDTATTVSSFDVDSESGDPTYQPE